MISAHYVIIAAAAALLVKWYTTKAIQKLHRKISGLRQARGGGNDKLQVAEKRRYEAEDEVEEMLSRVQLVQNIVNDLRVRADDSRDGEGGGQVNLHNPAAGRRENRVTAGLAAPNTG